MQERIQKIISAAGIMSRRAAEQLILEGRVRVNGAVVTELGTKADPEQDHIKVDGKLINPVQPRTYVMLNKPVGYVTTLSDPEGRPVVSDLLQRLKVRLYPVGRLDYNTEGLLLLTNDGDFAHLITHPSHELPKTYLVKIKGVLEDREVEHLERGVFLQDGKTAPARVRKLRKEAANSWIEITIHEGRKRQVRRMIDHTGHSVIKLKRIRVGNLILGDLPLGTFRHLTAAEVASLKETAAREPGPPTGPLPTAVRPAKQRHEHRREKVLVPEKEQRSLDAWATAAGKRRRKEREQKRRSALQRRPGRPLQEKDAKMRPSSGARGRGTFPRGEDRASERGAARPVRSRKPDFGGRGKASFGRGPQQEREAGAAGRFRDKKPRPGGRTKGSGTRGPGRSSERSEQRTTWSKRSGTSGLSRIGRAPQGAGESGGLRGPRPAMGKRSGPGGQPRTGHRKRGPKPGRSGNGRDR